MIIYLVIQQTLIGCVSLAEIELSVEIKTWEKNNFCFQGVKNIKMDLGKSTDSILICNS